MISPYPISQICSPHIPYPRFFTPQYPISQMCVTPPPPPCMKKYIPQKMTKNKHNLPWITSGVKRLMQRRDRYHKRAQRLGTPKAGSEYQAINKQVVKAIHTSYHQYLNEVIGDSLTNSEDNGSKTLWLYIKRMHTENLGIPTLKTGEDLHISNSDKPNALNDQLNSRSWANTIYTSPESHTQWCGETAI